MPTVPLLVSRSVIDLLESVIYSISGTESVVHVNDVVFTCAIDPFETVMVLFMLSGSDQADLSIGAHEIGIPLPILYNLNPGNTFESFHRLNSNIHFRGSIFMMTSLYAYP